MHDMFPSPLVKKQSTAQACFYPSAAKAKCCLIATRWSVSSSVRLQMCGSRWGNKGLFNDIIFKDFQIILVILEDDFVTATRFLLGHHTIKTGTQQPHFISLSQPQ